ncbi:MAG: isopenicillin N synthase family dioxygenase [Pseudomonadales bacterium]
MSITVIDFRSYDAANPATVAALADQLDGALQSHGFVALTNVGVSKALRQSAYDTAAAFFAQSPSAKAAFGYRDASANFGYQGPQVEALDPSAPADLKETFTMRDLPSHRDEAALWPSPAFAAVSAELFDACYAGAQAVLHVFAHALGVPDDFFASRHHGENTTLRYLYYPSGAVEQVQTGQMGAGAHTDYGSITLLFQDTVGGLQLQQDDGEWLDVPAIEDTVLLNTGDLMAHWSNDRYPSTMHRVAPQTGGQNRQSIAFFVDPDSSVAVQCLDRCVDQSRPARYAPTTAGEHIQRKILATH